MAGSSGLLLRCRAAAAVRASVSGRRRGAGPAGGAQAADAGQSGGAARLHGGRRGRPALLLAAVCPGLIRLPALLPLQPPRPRGPERRAGAGRRSPSFYLPQATAGSVEQASQTGTECLTGYPYMNLLL